MNLKQLATYEMQTKGVEEASAQFDRLDASQKKAGTSADVLTKQVELQEKAVTRVGSKLEAYARSNDPLAKALANVERGERLVAAARQQGLDVTEAQLRAVDQARARYTALTGATNDNTRSLDSHAKSVGLARHEWINLSRQFQDVGVSLAGGQAPLTVLAQQGSQIADVFSSSSGGAGAALKDFGATTLRFLTNPITLGVAAVGAATYSFIRWRDEIVATTIALNGLGHASGQTVFGVTSLAQSAADRAGISASSARGVAGQLLSAGVPGANIESGVGASVEFSRRFGVDLETAGKTLADALAEPAKGAETLAKQYGLVTFSEREHIAQIAALGNRSEASAKLVSILNERLAEMEDPTSRLAKLWETVKKGFFDGLDKAGRGLDRVIDGPAETQRKAESRARTALQGALRGLESEEAKRAQSLDRMREDSALAVKEIGARSYAEREAIARQRAWNEVMRSEVPDAIRAAMAAETERAKMLAESAKKIEDLTRTTNDNSKLAYASNPLERRLMEIENSRRDFVRENVPTSAAPMAKEFDTAAAAARNVADAFNGLAAAAGGRADGKIGRLVPLSEWRGGIGVSPNASAADPRGMSGYIRERADAYGIDPEIALRVARSEGLRDFNGDYVNGRPTSFGALQLHVGGGIGDEFRRDTGLDPSNPANEHATIDYALKIAAQRGWGPWHGAAKVGIGEWDGINGGARRLSVSRSATNDNGGLASATNSAFDKQVETAQYEARIKPQEDFAKSIILGRDALRARSETLGMDQRAIDESTKRQELMNEAIRQTGNILPEQKRWIEENAAAWADYQAEIRKVAEEEKQRKENLDIARSGVSGAFSGTLKAAANGENVGAALEQSLTRVRDNIFETISNRLTEGLLGKMGSADGGLLGGLLGGLGLGGQQQTAQMNVQAGVVTVNGGIGAGAGGGGGLLSGLTNWIGGLFGQNAEGTDNWRGGPTWVGERGPELVNLPRGSSVMPNAQSLAYARSLAAAASNDNRGGTVAAPVTVNLIKAPAGTEVKQSTDSRGGRRIDVVFDERIAAAAGSPQGMAVNRSLYGVKPVITRR